MPTYKNELERFVYEKCYDSLWTPLASWVAKHPNSLELLLPKWEETLWLAVVDMVTVATDGTMTFTFRNGAEVTA